MLKLLFITIAAYSADTDYFPLIIGQANLFHESVKAPPYALIDGIDVKRIEKISVDETVEQNGKIYFRVWTGNYSVNSTGGGVLSSILMRKDADGVYSINERYHDSPEIVEAKFPIKVGETHEVTFRGKPAKLIAVGLESITVEGVKYRRCYHFRTKSLDGKDVVDQWRAEGVGAVRTVSHTGRITEIETMWPPKKGATKRSK